MECCGSRTDWGRGMLRTGQLCLLLSFVAAGDLGIRESNVYHHGLYQLGAGTAILNADRLGIGECSRSLVDPGCRCLLKNGKITDARAGFLGRDSWPHPGKIRIVV